MPRITTHTWPKTNEVGPVQPGTSNHLNILRREGRLDAHESDKGKTRGDETKLPGYMTRTYARQSHHAGPTTRAKLHDGVQASRTSCPLLITQRPAHNPA
jgi:hypothetical protein